MLAIGCDGCSVAYVYHPADEKIAQYLWLSHTIRWHPENNALRRNRLTRRVADLIDCVVRDRVGLWWQDDEAWLVTPETIGLVPSTAEIVPCHGEGLNTIDEMVLFPEVRGRLGSI